MHLTVTFDAAPKNAADQRNKIISNNVVLQLLNNLVIQTAGFAAQLVNVNISLSLYFTMLKLLHNCQKSIALLNHCEAYESSHVNEKANLCIENIMEYLILLQEITGYQQSINELSVTECSNYSTTLKIDIKEISIFYSDSGQQAIAIAIMAMIKNHPLEKGIENRQVYRVGESYYEIPEFCGNTAISLTDEKANRTTAALWFCDINNIAQFKTDYDEITSLRKKMTTVIFDLTNDSSMATLKDLTPIISELRKSGLWVILSCSSLKHEEIGLDKYQFGRNVVLAPEGKQSLNKTAQNYFSNVSKAAAHPAIATFRQTVMAVVNEGGVADKLKNFGLFARTNTNTPVPNKKFLCN